MTEVGIKRLGAGDGEKYGSQRVKPDDAVVEQKRDAVGRIERPEHAGIARDPDQTGYRNRYKPDRRDRTKKGRNLRRAARLKRKQNDQNDNGDRHHEVVKRRRCNVEYLRRRRGLTTPA